MPDDEHQRPERPTIGWIRRTRRKVDDATAEFEASPVVRSVTRLQAECSDPDVTIRLASEPIDLRGLVRVEDDEGFGRWVRDREPPAA